MNLGWHFLWAGLGGAAGSMLRLAVSLAWPAGRLPWGTMTANVVGSLIIGLVLGRLGPMSADNHHWHGLLVVGFCGGFTTFSSFSWHTLEQLRNGQPGIALLHVLLSVVVCLLATWVGWRLGRV